ncbi:hypothetical protein [Robertmurraya siralis]|uniref:hypothetical protein n=1 Tax=Robertmurraya siralis TaxID=77777 RepID=UPI0010F58243|nr:hypothetical protein [Robertmurraya siralis]
MSKNNRKNFGLLGDPIEFKNVPKERKFNPLKKYYASIFLEGSSKLVTYESKQRSEAVSYFNKIARLENGHVEVVGVFK